MLGVLWHPALPIGANLRAGSLGGTSPTLPTKSLLYLWVLNPLNATGAQGYRLLRYF